MPCYFFHLEDGDTTHDFPGMDLLDLGAVRDEVMRTSLDLLLDRAKDLPKDLPWSTKPWRMWVTDEPARAGKALLTLQFTATEA